MKTYQLAALVVALSWIVFAVVSARTALAPAPPSEQFWRLDWTAENVPDPGPGWVLEEDGLRAGEEGGVFTGSLETGGAEAVYCRVGGTSGVAVILQDSAGGQRIVRPEGPALGRETVFIHPASGPVRVLVTARPGSRLTILEAGKYQEIASLPPLVPLVIGLVLLSLAFLYFRFPDGRPSWKEVMRWAGLGIAMSVAFVFAWSRFTDVRMDGLEPDANSFRDLASGMRHPWDSSWREPLWPAMIRVWWLIAPESAASLRLLGVVIAPLTVLAAYLLIEKLHHSPAAAMLGAYVVSSNDLLFYSASRGLRAPFFTLAATTFAAIVLMPGRTWRWLALGIVSAILCLTRMESLAFVAVALPVAAWRERPSDWKWPSFGAAAFLVLVLPWFGQVWVQFGTPLYAFGQHSKGVAARIDRAEGKNLDLETIHSGREVSPVELVMRKVGPVSFAARWLRGWNLLAFDPSSVQLQWLLGAAVRSWVLFVFYPLWLIGLIAWAAGPRRWSLLLLLGSAHVIPFIAAGVADPRYSAHLVPYMAGAIALAVLSGWNVITSVSRRGKEERP